MTDELSGLRAGIDDLDDRIAGLVAERRTVSSRIQELRLAGGGGPIDPAREQIVIASYQHRLGTAGPALAHAVLDACRPRPA